MTSSTTPQPKRVIDVSLLPSGAMDYRSAIWWGNTLLLLIETSMFVIAIATYFYLRRNFDTWPPPKVDQIPVLYHPYPVLPLATLNLGLLLLSLVPMVIADRACLKMNEPLLRACATISVLMAIVIIYLRFKEFPSLLFRWDDNAYGSIVWVLMGLHLMHLVVVSLEDTYMTVWVWVKGLDDKHARDIRFTAVYWYWVVGVWVVLYFIIYWVPRIT